MGIVNSISYKRVLYVENSPIWNIRTLDISIFIPFLHLYNKDKIIVFGGHNNKKIYLLDISSAKCKKIDKFPDRLEPFEHGTLQISDKLYLILSDQFTLLYDIYNMKSTECKNLNWQSPKIQMEFLGVFLKYF